MFGVFAAGFGQGNIERAFDPVVLIVIGGAGTEQNKLEHKGAYNLVPWAGRSPCCGLGFEIGGCAIEPGDRTTAGAGFGFRLNVTAEIMITKVRIQRSEREVDAVDKQQPTLGGR